MSQDGRTPETDPDESEPAPDQADEARPALEPWEGRCSA